VASDVTVKSFGKTDRAWSLRSAVLLILCMIVFEVGPAHALPERRVALVIGNSEYKDQSLTLSNPKNDASDIAEVLKSLDFEVHLQLNTSKRDLDASFEKFARLAATADTALFFYAGHAIQYNGKNYLMPVDAELKNEISYNLVSLDDARSALDLASGVKIMILDACRNNPVADRLSRLTAGRQSRGTGRATRGLARIDRTEGMVIAFATAADDIALDGNARNSPFTSALLKEMQVPGLEIGTMLRRVASDVSDQTFGRQRPETSISLLSDYYLNQSDRKIWESMRETADIAQIQEFLRHFPTSVSALDARDRLNVLERAKQEHEDEQAAAERSRQQKLEEQRATKLEQDRIDAAKALQEEAGKRRQAAENLAKIEQNRVQGEQQAAQREEARRKEQKAPQNAVEACNVEQSNIDSIGNDEAKLKHFATTSVCADATLRAQARLASLQTERERQERACDSESKQLAALAKIPSESRDRLLELQASLTCEKLRPTVVEAIGRVDVEIKRKLVRNSQAELRRIGCYRGTEDGELNDATMDALKRASVKLGTGDRVPNINEALLSELKRLEAPVCRSPKPEPEENPVVNSHSSTPNLVGATDGVRPGHSAVPGTTPKNESSETSATGVAAQHKDARLPGTPFKDCEDCPEMMVAPAGRFTMGSPDSEGGRRDIEGPQRMVEVRSSFAAGRYAITRDQFDAFVKATARLYDDGCYAESSSADKWILRPDLSFRSPGFAQDGRHPVVCISWEDANAYVEWLSAKTGKSYRLLTEAEREYVTRAGTTTPYWWGSTIRPDLANYDKTPDQPTSDQDLSTKARTASASPGPGKSPTTKAKGTVPVDFYQSNPWGLFQVHGNVAEWVEDCWNRSYKGAPSDTSAVKTGDCNRRVLRGGGWSYWASDVRSAYRESARKENRYVHVGFRVARDLI
jgi:formylglycine-generating enzyme required for sulfatase activity/uncharacterized caspase-like protein